MTTFNREREHEDVYGKSFALYGGEQMKQFTGFFEQRLLANGLDGKDLFEGKRCLDAGCGNGRGSLLMLKNGAAHVTALDISEENLRSVDRNLKSFGYSNFACRQTSLEKIDISDETFDFVWCNGVLMHTANPDKCLQEITRTLRIGGRSWIYVYGSNGLYWYLINRFRSWFKQLDPGRLLGCLQMMNVEVRYIGEYMDDWKVPYLRSYTNSDFSKRLREVGFGTVNRLWRGVSYDTSERLERFPNDRPWLGEGDLRYLLTKTGVASVADGRPLSDDEFGSKPDFDRAIARNFDEPLRDLEAAIGSNVILGVLVASNLQRRLRDIMSEDKPIDVVNYQRFISLNCDAARTLASAASGRQ
jgi:ubiquinone/menaquinone biosynthesis C-methylase UbiE